MRSLTFALAAVAVGLPVLTTSPVYAAPCAIVEAAAGYDHALALLEDGSLWAWGNNRYGQLGDGTPILTTPYGIAHPVQVRGLEDVVALDGGAGHSIAAGADGTVWTWGLNDQGQLGDGTATDASLPQQVAGLADIVAVAAGQQHSLALSADGAVWAWGQNDQGQLGDGTNNSSATPVQVGIVNVDKISAMGSGDHTLALKLDRSVWAWGEGRFGQLGQGFYASSNVPVRVTGIVGLVNDIGAGAAHSLAITSDVWAWGSNDNAALGQAPPMSRSNVPLRVPGQFGQLASAGSSSSHVIRNNRTLWSWGEAQQGQMGNGTSPDFQLEPVQATGLAGVDGVDSGGSWCLVRLGDAAYTFGWAQNGALGNGTFDIATLPVAVDLSYFDATPPDQGNVLRAVRANDDVRLDYPAAPSSRFRLYADPDKRQLGMTQLTDVATRVFVDAGAILRADDDYYRVSGRSRCSGTPGP